MTIERSEPAYSNDEVGMLRSFLDHYRATIRLQASGLTDAQLDQALPPSDLTLGGMLKHLAFVEDYWFSYNLRGHEPSPPWDAAPWDDDGDWDWHSAKHDNPGQLRDLYDAEVDKADAVIASMTSLDTPSARKSGRTGEHFNLRWVLVHLVEEYARHNGHADLIREGIDGVTGE